MRNELAGSSLLTAGHTCALRLSASTIQALADAAWAEIGKRHGRVTIDKQITVQVRDGRIVTTITGTYDPSNSPPKSRYLTSSMLWLFCRTACSS